MKPILFTFLSLFLLTETFSQNCNQPNSLVSVSKRKSGRTEYVIFSLKKPATTSPAVSTVSPPFAEDGSGNTITIAGCKYKKVRFENIVWTCTISNQFAASTYLVRQVRKIGQFEGLIEYVIGYRCNTKSVVSYSYDDGSLKKFVVRFKY